MERRLSSLRLSKGVKKRAARDTGRMRFWRIARNVAIVILLWFALLGVCIISYDYYFKFSN